MAPERDIDLLDQNVDLVRIPLGPTEQTSAFPNVVSFWSANALLIVAATPFLLALLYFLFFAAARYESEASFVVRSPSRSAASQIANLVQGPGIVSSSDEAYVVHEFIQSRDAMRSLIANDDLKGAFGKSGLDFFWSTPGWFGEPSNERLYRHYLKFITVLFDKTTGISTLRVQAFTPEDAKTLVTALLRQSERLLNRLNERSQKDAVASAEKQVEESKARAYDARGKITVFRNRESVIDPTLLSSAVVETVTRLSLETALLNAQLAELRISSPESPQINSIKYRLAALDAQILKERSQLGGTDASLAPRISEYERLALERDFADQAFTSALNTLELANVDAVRQRAFLEEIASPNLPDYAKYPYRLIWIMTAGIASLGVCWIARKLFLDTLTHAEN